MTSPPSLAERFRSGYSNSSTSLSLASSSTAASTPSRTSTPSGSSGALHKSYRPKYHSRSQSSNPSPSSSTGGKPIVLPFPDLPVRPISRDGSRAGSPTGPRSRTPMSSPGWTPRGSSTNLLEVAEQTSGMLSPPRQGSGSGSGLGSAPMATVRSMDGGSGSSSREGRSSPFNRTTGHSTSASPSFTSPLASSSAPRLDSSSSSFRPRAFTSPAPVDIPQTHDGPSAASPPPILSARGSGSTSYASPSSPLAFSPTSPPLIASGSASGSATSASILPSTTGHNCNEAFVVPPPTPEKDRPPPLSKPTKKSSTGSSVTIHPPSGYIPLTPATPTQPLQDHLYRSFLSGECADVRLWVRNWGVGWLVHKMVLVQAGFFHTLFLGGFSETGVVPKVSSRKGKERATGVEDDDWKGEDVELRFDDPNITREAFEICLSRLYSPHPRLLFPLALLPTPAHPLTPIFPNLQPPTSPSAVPSSTSAISTTTSPQLLLSILATTIYLGHAPLMREVLSVILRTVGPGTIGRYLGFALGDGCGEAEEIDSVRNDVYKSIAKPLPRSMCLDESEDPEEDEREDEMGDYHQSGTHRDSTTSTDSRPEDDVKVGSLPQLSYLPSSSSSTLSKTESGTASVHRTISNASTIRPPSLRLGLTSARNSEPQASSMYPDGDIHSTSLDSPTSMPHFYGFASDKIGEACACWLSRWGLDLLSAESSLSDKTSKEGYRIFRHRGIPASFLRGLLSSDNLWVKGEMERYMAVRDILLMRRSGWEAEWESAHPNGEDEIEGEDEVGGWEEWDEDEEQLERVFAEGIYYSHMSFEDLSIIANDIDPTTNLPFAPLSVLQAAHWAAADLKKRIIANDNPGTPNIADQGDEAELGLTVTSAELAEIAKRSMRRVTPRGRVASPSMGSSSTSGKKRENDSSLSLISSGSANSIAMGRRTVSGTSTIGMGPHAGTGDSVYHPIPTDDTHRAGAGGLLFLPSGSNPISSIQGVSGMPDLGPSGASAGLGGSDDETGPNGKRRAPPAGEKTWFGLQNGSRTQSEITASLNPPISSSFFYTSTSSASRGEARWTPTQPFRFSVEFWDVDTLPEKERLYSTTHFHAGSWWNVYVQTIRKKDKGTQLGVYLHRQSLKEGVPSASRVTTGPIGRVGQGEIGPDVLEARGTRVEARRERRSEGDISARQPTGRTVEGRAAGSMSALAQGSPPELSTSMQRGDGRGLQSAQETSPGENGDIEADMVGVETYKDARRITRAYFSITCASALGTALIRFSSSPDSFTLSQSWGWKSSALRSEEYLAVAPVPSPDGEGVLGWVGEMPTGEGGKGRGSLRATVVVGVI